MGVSRRAVLKSRLPRPRLAVTLGDAAGVGPEVLVRALADPRVLSRAQVLVLGDCNVLARADQVCRTRLRMLECASAAEAWQAPSRVIPVLNPFPLRRVVPGRWSVETGMASAVSVCRGADWVMQGLADALVTGPICKEAWQAAGVTAPGHTELLAALTGCKKYAMMFVGGPFALVLATIHEPLARVPEILTRAKIITAAALAVRELQGRFGLRNLKVVVAGLNPHAGEGGMFGSAEARVIAPAIRQLRRLPGVRVEGPLAPDTLFVDAARGRWDLVVGMYHDQGLIPFKMLALHSGVNVTAGLPLIRTSPDHGTAFALAGTGRADPGSMIAALLTASDMARHVYRSK